MRRLLASVFLLLVLVLAPAPAPATASAMLSAWALGDTTPAPRPATLESLGVEHGDLRVGFYLRLDRALAPTATQAERDRFVDFLRSTLIPHAQLEERVLYPALESALQTHGLATATLVLDHRAVAKLTLELATLGGTNPAAFASQAQALAGIVERHFQNEEDFVFPSLERKLDERSLRAVLRGMETERIVPLSPR